MMWRVVHKRARRGTAISILPPVFIQRTILIGLAQPSPHSHPILHVLGAQNRHESIKTYVIAITIDAATKVEHGKFAEYVQAP